MRKHFFSVIVPAYNSAGYIRKGLQSIRGQSFRDYELIVVCDACRDETAEIAREYADKTIITDHGLDGLARNAGLDAAEGKWILFMDDDDWFLHEFVFQQIAEKVTAVEMDILAFSFIWKGRGYTRQEPGRHFIAVWNKCWRRDFIGDTRFSNVPYWSDKDFNRGMYIRNPKVYYWDMPMYYYNYLREGSISWRKVQGEIE